MNFAGGLTSVNPQVNSQPTLSGLTETVFGYGTPIARATTHDETVKNVYIRMNYNEWVRQGKPSLKREYFSSTLIGGVIWKYRTLALDRKVGYYSPSSTTTTEIDMIRQGCCDVVPSRDVAKKIMDNLYYAAYGTGANVDPNFVDPPLNNQPSERAVEQERRMDADAAQKEATDDCGFFCKIGRGISGPFQALGNFTTIMSYAIPLTLVTVAGGVVYLMVSKGRQFDVNRAYAENHRTIRKIGPDTAAAIVRKGM